MLSGSSPWPVVETTYTTRGSEGREVREQLSREQTWGRRAGR